MADHQEVTTKISEALKAADRCSAAETSDSYSALNEQLWELNSLLGQSLQSHVSYQPILTKLQNGTALTTDELKALRSLIVGDADQYLKYDDDFERSKRPIVDSGICRAFTSIFQRCGAKAPRSAFLRKPSFLPGVLRSLSPIVANIDP